MRVATWNLERKRPTSLRGAEAVEYMASLDAEVMVLTETRTSFELPGGRTAWATPPLASFFDDDERKVVVWSAAEFEPLEFDSPIDPSRFVALRVNASIGSLVVLAICIPWHMSEVTYHEGRPKKKPWEEHLEYLKHLKVIFDSLDEPFVVAGDFNQHIPRLKGENHGAAEAIEVAFNGVEILTTDVLPGCSKPGIDHIAISSKLRSTKVAGWPHNVNGNRLSDHDGAMADIELRRSFELAVASNIFAARFKSAGIMAARIANSQ